MKLQTNYNLKFSTCKTISEINCRMISVIISTGGQINIGKKELLRFYNFVCILNEKTKRTTVSPISLVVE